jgi:2-phosphosulfolactate phosphatase
VKVEALFSPADFALLPKSELSETVCVVFDILRATSTMVTALASGAKAVVPVLDIEEALAWRRKHPEVLLGGERGGRRIGSELTGGVEFDLGNSPREYTPDRVRGRIIASTTTNGTRALRACAGAQAVLAASFVNLGATARWLEKNQSKRLLLVCSGTQEEHAWEDTLAAGALWDRLLHNLKGADAGDSVSMAHHIFLGAKHDLLGSMRFSRNGKRLLAVPELADDVPLCLKADAFDIVAALSPGGEIHKVASEG